MRRSGARRASRSPCWEGSNAAPSPSSGPAPVRAAGTGRRSTHRPARGRAPPAPRQLRGPPGPAPARPRPRSDPQPPPSGSAPAPIPAVPERPRAAAPSPGSGAPEPKRPPGSAAPPRPAPPRAHRRCAVLRAACRSRVLSSVSSGSRPPPSGAEPSPDPPARLRAAVPRAVSEELQPPLLRASASPALRRAPPGRSAPSTAPQPSFGRSPIRHPHNTNVAARISFSREREPGSGVRSRSASVAPEVAL